MTYQEFLTYLSKLQWTTIKVVDRTVIRWKDEPLNCPITAVYADKTKGTCSANLYMTAARELRLDNALAAEIARAADGYSHADPVIRQDLEKVCRVK